MKYTYLLATLVAASLFSSCSSDGSSIKSEEEIIADEEANDIWRINLGGSATGMSVSSGLSRASIDGIPEGGLELGIFGLSRKNYSDDNNGSWATPSADSNMPVLLDNIEGLLAKPTNPTDYASIQLKTQGGTYGDIFYYPMTNNYLYKFYGYYPRVENTAVTHTANSVSIDFGTIDGTNDIIFGHSTIPADITYNKEYPVAATEQVPAFCAKYMRAAKLAADADEQAQASAKIDLKHMLTQFSFVAQAAYDQVDADASFVTNNMHITAIKIKNQRNQPVITINKNADVENYALSFKTQTPLVDLNVGNVIATTQIGGKPTGSEGNWNVDVAAAIGDGIMFQPGQTSITAEVTINCTATGTNVPAEQTQTIVITNEKGFQAGYKYKIIISVYAYQEIKATAVLVPWTVGENYDAEVG